MQPHGGYKSVSVIQFCNGLAAYDAGVISFRALRVYFAAFAMVAAREAARRSAGPRQRRRSAGVRYRLEEFERLTGIAMGEVRGLLRRLCRVGLIVFSESAIIVAVEPLPEAAALAEVVSGRGRSLQRWIPVPRPVLRLLARSNKPAFVKILVGYLIRGLSIDRATGEPKGKGSVKLTWIADAFGISERAARYARRELIRIGLLTGDGGSTQRKLNRDGAYFTIVPGWSDAARCGGQAAHIAPRTAHDEAEIAPPTKDRKTSSELKDQTTRRNEASGVCGRGAGTPSLHAIRPDDLRRVSSVLTLYEQAIDARWLERSEANRRNFVAAAVRAVQAHGDPVRIFVAIVRRRLWHHITQSQEERAVRAMKSFDARVERTFAGTRQPTVSADVTRRPADGFAGILATTLSAISARSSVMERTMEGAAD